MSIQKHNPDLLEKVFIQIKEDNKKQKVNFNSGIVCGLLLANLAQAKGMLDGDPNTEYATMFFENAIANCKQLVEVYHWKRSDLIYFISEYGSGLKDVNEEKEP